MYRIIINLCMVILFDKDSLNFKSGLKMCSLDLNVLHLNLIYHKGETFVKSWTKICNYIYNLLLELFGNLMQQVAIQDF